MHLSHSFINRELRDEINTLEHTIKRLDNCSEEETMKALKREYPKDKVHALNQMYREDVYLGSKAQKEYIVGLLIPALKVMLVGKNAGKLRLEQRIEINYVCPKCGLQPQPPTWLTQKYVLESDIFEDISTKGKSSDYYRVCPKKTHTRPVPMEIKNVTNRFDFPMHLDDYKIHTVMANVKHGTDLAFKLICRLGQEDVLTLVWDLINPILDLYRGMVVAMTPTPSSLQERHSGFLRQLDSVICEASFNPRRESYNKRILKEIAAVKRPQNSRDWLEVFNEAYLTYWKMPISRGDFFNAPEDSLPLADDEESYRAQKIADWRTIPIRIHLTPFPEYKKYMDGTISHPEYEKRRKEDAKRRWKPYQLAAYDFLVTSHFFSRSPIYHP